MGLVIFFFFGAGFLGGTSGQGFGVGALFPESEAFWWSEFMVNFGYSSLSFLLFYSALNSGLLIVLSAREALTSSQNLWRGPLLISIFAISLLSMSVPVMGTRHFWWALPIALLASSLIATRVHMTRSEISRSLLALPVIAIIAVAGLSGMAFAFLVDREKLPEESSARGMVGRVEIVALAERDLQFVSRIDGNGNTYFIVNSGHLASLTGHYDSADEMFVSWGPQESIDSRLKYPAQIVVDETADHERLVEQLENSGFRTTVDKSNERYLLIFVTK